MVRIILSILVIAVVAYLVYQYQEKKRVKPPTKLTVNYVSPKTGSKVVTSDLSNGLNADEARVTVVV